MPKFRRVTGLFRAATPDGPDEDYTPELEALNGQIEFIPKFRDGVIAYPRLDPPEFVRPEPIQAVLQDGRVMTQVSVGEETVIQPVELLVSDDDEATQSWQWEAVFRDIRVGRWGDEVSISPLRFTVPDEHGPLDLTEVVGEKSGGTITVKGPRGEGITDLRAENGQLIVEWGAGKQLTIPVPEAVPGPKGDKGDRGDTGPVGPVNVGVNSVSMVNGAFRFQFTDGRPSQDITLPLASNTSAGLQRSSSAYDSGWVNILSRSIATGGTLEIRRTGALVEVVGEALTLTGATGRMSFVSDLGAGWRPQRPAVFQSVSYWSSWGEFPMRITTGGGIEAAFGSVSNPTVTFHVTYLTRDAPPTSLPV